jgi:hypothetical protein
MGLGHSIGGQLCAALLVATTAAQAADSICLGYVNPQTCTMYPQNDKGVLVDTSAAWYSDFGNGPEWLWLQGDSQLVPHHGGQPH